MKGFKRFNSKDPDTQKVIDNLTDVFKPLIDNPILDGVMLKDIKLTVGVQKIINHKLNRKYRGWIVVRKNSNANIWETTISDNKDSLYIILNCSANTEIDIYIF